MTSLTNTVTSEGKVTITVGVDDESKQVGGVAFGGSASFFMALVFLVLYYLRPQDWVPGMAGMGIIKPIIGIWAVVLFANGAATPIKGLFKTPHDWAMLAYYGYVVWTAPDTNDTLTAFLPLVVFYFLTVQSIGTWRDLLKYLEWWNWVIVIIALIAVASLYGLDLTGAQEATASKNGRLSIGTWIHNNPNALAHTVVVVLSTAYLLYFWRSPLLSRLFIYVPSAMVVGYCAYMTESKGAYVAGAMLMVLLFIFGRPKMVQVFAISFALVAGVSSLSFLPRMSQMGNLRADEGVQGRLMAWELARETSRNETTGVGYKQFLAYIPWKVGNSTIYVEKATHSSYVQIAADLGGPGLFLYLLSLWLAFRGLIGAKSEDDDIERCRRLLLILLAANVVSGWMINRQYHTEYFLLIAATAVFHRLRYAEQGKDEQEVVTITTKDEDSDPRDVLAVEDLRVSHLSIDCEQNKESLSDGEKQSMVNVEGVESPAKIWNKLSWVDVLAGVVITWLTFYVWDYIMNNI